MTMKLESQTVPSSFNDDPQAWLTQQAGEYSLNTLLAYADDGAIWGRIENGVLTLAGAAYPEVAVALRASTLQQARLFGSGGELMLWKDGGDFCARLITETAEDDASHLDQCYQLWGRGIEVRNGFTLMEEGREGLYHAPPENNGLGRRMQLTVRHYLAEDENGQTYINASRLVELKTTE